MVLINKLCQNPTEAHSTALFLFFLFFLEDCWWWWRFLLPSSFFLHFSFGGLNGHCHGSLLTYCVFLVSKCVQVWIFTPWTQTSLSSKVRFQWILTKFVAQGIFHSIVKQLSCCFWEGFYDTLYVWGVKKKSIVVMRWSLLALFVLIFSTAPGTSKTHPGS